MGRWKVAEMVADPWVSATNSIPIIVLIPGLYFSIGGGFLADVFISFVLSVFTVIMNTHARNESLDLATRAVSLGGGRVEHDSGPGGDPGPLLAALRAEA